MWPLGTVIVDFFVVSVKVGTVALLRAQIGRFVVFNTHSYLAPSLGLSRAIPLLPASHDGIWADFYPYFTWEFKAQRLQSLDANDSSTIRTIVQ